MPLPMQFGTLFGVTSTSVIRPITGATQVLARRRARSRRSGARHGLTLIEMLVSVTLTLLVVFAIVQVFDMLGQTMTKGRAAIEMAGNLRSVANRLQEDLDSLTCPVRPWLDPAAGEGYFEYVEGMNVPLNQPRYSDMDAVNNTTGQLGPDTNADSGGTPGHFGDLDDILMMTIRATGEPFRGRYDVDGNPANGYEIVESEYAEVIWWTTIDPDSNTISLHRRVLLIRPDIVIDPTKYPLAGPADLKWFYQLNDISVRVDSALGALTTNSLADLTTPRNRFAHYRLNENYGASFTGTLFAMESNVGWVFPLDVRYLWPRNPYDLTMQWSRQSGTPAYDYSLVLGNQELPSGRIPPDRTGDDVMLSDVLAFDIRAYDPDAIIQNAGNFALAPGDPGYVFGGAGVGTGAFVDLANASGLMLSSLPNNPIEGGDPAKLVSYDTWSLGFERDGINQDGDSTAFGPLVDEGFDGLDNEIAPSTTFGGVDDYDERETRPPYNVPLSGIEVRIRMMEYSTRQIRQVSVIGDFTQ